jgi:hypothetical protein
MEKKIAIELKINIDGIYCHKYCQFFAWTQDSLHCFLWDIDLIDEIDKNIVATHRCQKCLDTVK